RCDVDAVAQALAAARLACRAALLAIRFATQPHALLAAQDRAAFPGQAQRAVPVRVGREQPGRDELAEDAAPLARVELRADPERAQAVMAERAHARVVLAAQYPDEMADAVALAGAVHARQCLLRDDA